jgi:hypothetical protein
VAFVKRWRRRADVRKRFRSSSKPDVWRALANRRDVPEPVVELRRAFLRPKDLRLNFSSGSFAQVGLDEIVVGLIRSQPMGMEFPENRRRG